MKDDKKVKGTDQLRTLQYTDKKTVKMDMKDKLFEELSNYTKCAICGSSKNVRDFKDKKICFNCINLIKGV